MIDDLIFSESPTVILGGNQFVRVPVILQFEETPLIEIVPATVKAGFTSRFSIFNSDGVQLAKVFGSRMDLTKDGRKAGLTLRHPDKMTVCELGKKTLFEIRRTEAAAMKTAAELYTPSGQFVRCIDRGFDLFQESAQTGLLQVGGLTLIGNQISDCAVGIWMGKDGAVGFAVNR